MGVFIKILTRIFRNHRVLACCVFAASEKSARNLHRLVSFQPLSFHELLEAEKKSIKPKRLLSFVRNDYKNIRISIK